MSDILIRGMKMYERCNDPDGHWGCPLFGSVYPYGFFCKAIKKEINDPFSRQPGCPLIPIPPHGRTIDADVLLKKCEFVCTDDDVDVRAVRYSVIDAAPTIIPAEEDE